MTMSDVLTVALVGEYRLFRECLAARLAGEHGLRIVAQGERVDALHDARPEVLLLDVGGASPDRCCELVRGASASLPGVKLVVLGLDASDEAILRCVEAGASAYVIKEASVEELAEVVAMVRRGEAPCPPDVAFSMFSRLAQLAAEREREERFEGLDLSPREMEILGLIAGGLGNKQIAAELNLSLHTVKNHVHHILEKLQVPDRAAAVEIGYRKRWLSRRPRPTP